MRIPRSGHHTCAHRVDDLQAHWMCDCHYHNVVAFRCYGCGARPPRQIRALLKALLIEATRPPRRPGPTRRALAGMVAWARRRRAAAH